MGRNKLDRVVLQVRVASDTPEKLKKIALSFGFQWGDNGNTGALLDAIANLSAKELKQLSETWKNYKN